MKSRVIQGVPWPGEGGRAGQAGHEEGDIPVVDIRAGGAAPRPVRGSVARPGGPGSGTRAARAAKRLEELPFTLSITMITVLVGVATAALWRPLADRPLMTDVAYGLPAFREGRWWTLVAGPLFAQSPLQYVPTLGTFVLLCGFAELMLGTRRTAALAGITHVAGVLGAAALLALCAGHGWAWADGTATARDLGFSAGALGAAAAATVVLTPPWRWRARAVLTTYAVASFVCVGVLWGLQHLIAVGAGLALGPALVGRRPRLCFRA